MAHQYDDRTTRYDPNDTYGRYGDYGSAYDNDYGVSHSHSYGHHGSEYPSQQHRRYRNHPVSAPAPAEYEYDHGQYDYPTGVADPSATAPYAGYDSYGVSAQQGQAYEPDPHIGEFAPHEPSAHGAGYAHSNPSAYGGGYAGSGSNGAYGAGLGSHVGDVYQADEAYGRDHVHDRKKRPKLLGTVFCFFLLAGIGVACGVMLAVVFIRPPNVGVAGYASPSIFLQNQTLMVNTTVYAAVSNPNSIGAKVKHMHATIYERNAQDHVLGTSRADGLQIGSHSNTTLKLPVQIQIASANNVSASAQTLQDVAQNCGWDLGALSGAFGSNIATDSRSDRSSTLNKRSNAIPLLVDLDIKVSVMAVDFHTPVHNLSLDVRLELFDNRQYELFGHQYDQLEQHGSGGADELFKYFQYTKFNLHSHEHFDELESNCYIYHSHDLHPIHHYNIHCAYYDGKPHTCYFHLLSRAFSDYTHHPGLSSSSGLTSVEPEPDYYEQRRGRE